MRRLEYARRVRAVPSHARTSAEAVTCLAQVARERHRLHQERTSLAKRLRRIDARLNAITVTESKLVPMIRLDTQAPSLPLDTAAPVLPRPTPALAGALTLQY